MADGESDGGPRTGEPEPGFVITLDNQRLRFPNVLSCSISSTLAGVVASQQAAGENKAEFARSLRVTATKQDGKAEAQILVIFDQYEFLYEGIVTLKDGTVVWSGDFLKFDPTDQHGKRPGRVTGEGKVSC